MARLLLDIGAVGFSPREPITFKSGIVSPVYGDNRRIIYWPQQWQQVIAGLQELIAAQALEFDVIAGIATGGVPHSSALAFTLAMPSVYVRKESKDHGTQNRIEGGEIRGQQVLLVEDMVTTGGSSLNGVTLLRDSGATVTDCLAITTFGFPMAYHAFQVANVRLHALTDFYTIVQEGVSVGKLDASDIEIIEDWLHEPHHWAERHGLADAEEY
jgi:orotate phosphoribosyltransferase